MNENVDTQHISVTIRTDVLDAPDSTEKAEEYDQLIQGLRDAVNGRLYECGAVGHNTRVQIGETAETSNSNRGSSHEMAPRLTKTDYKSEVKAIAKRTLHRFADDNTGEIMEIDDIEIRTIIGETEMFHERFPFSILEHSHHESNPGAWEWIEDATPKTSLVRYALDVLAGDVSSHMGLLMEFERYTHRRDGIIYLRKTVDQPDQSTDEEENPTIEVDSNNDSTNGGNDNPTTENEYAPDWELPANEAGEPDYEGIVEQIGLKSGQVFNIDTEYYRYHSRRNHDIVVEPLTEYGEIVEDCLAIGYIWAAYCEGRIGHGQPLTGHGMVRGVTNATGDSHIGLKPSDTGTDMESSFARIGLENVPERGAFFVDYRYGEDMPSLTLYDATEDDRLACQFLLPTRERPTVQLVADRTTDLSEELATELRERIESVNESGSEINPQNQ